MATILENLNRAEPGKLPDLLRKIGIGYWLAYLGSFAGTAALKVLTLAVADHKAVITGDGERVLALIPYAVNTGGGGGVYMVVPKGMGVAKAVAAAGMTLSTLDVTAHVATLPKKAKALGPVSLADGTPILVIAAGTPVKADTGTLATCVYDPEAHTLTLASDDTATSLKVLWTPIDDADTPARCEFDADEAALIFEGTDTVAEVQVIACVSPTPPAGMPQVNLLDEWPE